MGPDDGRKDPSDVKIEDTPIAKAHQMAWERELNQPKPKRGKLRRALNWLGHQLIEVDPTGNPIF
jgi:hypothetical protein